ncbi:MAG: hypothetical protein DYG89_10720 [Caldilinea sp. CFX5]|nr:hypothetical protein [Caldilinea sp. CFX5]
MTKIIRLLGGFQVDDNGCALTGFQSDKARALLAYLAVEADRPHRRAQLAGLFWPEWPEQTALTYLRHALANLRKVLGEGDAQAPPLLVTRHTIQFNPHTVYQVDLAQVTKALQSLTAPVRAIDHLQQAVAAYHHVFLEGFYLNGCAAFEEWLLLTRERLQRQIIDALRYLADHFEGQGHYQPACAYAQRRVELEPWLEEAHRQIMRLHALNGQRSAALAHYDRCRRQLAAELGVEPSAETNRLYELIRTGQFDKVRGWQGDKVTQLPTHPVTLSPPHLVTPSPKHNLPAPTTPLLGRTNELATLQGLLQREAVRLVTLTGPGGVGKTRLALAVAGQGLADFADGVFVTFLAPLREPTLVLSALAQTLTVGEMGSRPLFERLVTALGERRLLLVLDNFEHLLTAAPVIADLLAACPRLKVLATSRERLRLQGEHEYVTSPLAAPTFTTELTPATLQQWPAIELFCQRAAAARHDFVLTPENATAIATICTRLDGLPLAIELAAARSKLLSPQALVKRLTDPNGDLPLHFLKTDTRNVESRHRSLWDTIAWSYALLDPDEQRFFRQLAVFVGGCTPEAVAVVCDVIEERALDGLATLVDKHLLQVTPDENQLRFTMLETLREFGLAQVTAAQELAAMQARHAHYFVQFVAGQSPRLMDAESADALAQLQADHANVRVAFQWLLAAGDTDHCSRLGADLLQFWTSLEQFKEAETYLQATLRLAAGHPPSPAYVNLLASAGFVAFLRGQSELGARYFVQCLAMNDEIDNLGNPKKIGIANGLLAWHCFDQGDYQAAHRYFAAAQANDMETGDEWALAMTLANRGKMAAELGDFAQAEVLLQEALQLHRRIGQIWGIALTLTNQGILYIHQRRFAKAAHVLAERAAMTTQSMFAEPKMLLGIVAMENGEYDRATALLKEALLYELERSAPRYLLPVVEAIVQLAIKQTHFSVALSLAAATCAQRRQLKLMMPPVEKQFFDEAIVTARGQLAEEATTSAWAKGEAMTLDETVAYALAEVTVD